MDIPRKTVAIIGVKGYPFVFGGFETFVTELVERLGSKYEFHVYCHRTLYRHRPKILNGVHLHYFRALETKHLNHLTHGLAATLHAIYHRYDIIFFLNSVHTPFGILARLMGRRCVLNADGMEWLKPQVGLVGSFYYRVFSRVAHRASDALVSDSRVIEDHYRDRFGASSCFIPYGARLDVEPEESALEQFGLTERNYYLVAGRLVPDNNADLIIEGFLRSSTSRKLVVLGDTLFPSRYDRRLKRLQTNGRVVFTGFVRDPRVLRALFSKCHVYLHGHEYGGTNPILLEALASQCCVAALDVPFNREVLNGDAFGLYFRKSSESVRKLIDTLEQDAAVCAQFRQRSRQRISQGYTWERVTEDYDALFQRVISCGEATHEPTRG